MKQPNLEELSKEMGIDPRRLQELADVQEQMQGIINKHLQEANVKALDACLTLGPDIDPRQAMIVSIMESMVLAMTGLEVMTQSMSNPASLIANLNQKLEGAPFPYRLKVVHNEH